MAYSFVHYAGDGNTTLFIVPFPFIKEDDVIVTIDDVVANDVTYSGVTSRPLKSI